MMRAWALLLLFLAGHAWAQSAGTVSLPTGSGANSPASVSAAVNSALAAKQDYGGNILITGSYAQTNGNILVQPSNNSSSTDSPLLNLIRVATHSGGSTGSVLGPARIYEQVGANVKNAEWPLSTTLNDYHTSSGTTNVSAYIQATKYSTGGVGSAVIDARDYTLQPSASVGGLVSLEIDNTSGNVDNYTTPLRSWLLLVGAKTPGATVNGQIGAGIRMGFQTGTGSIGTVLRLENSTPINTSVFDLTGAALASSAPVIKTNDGAMLWDERGDGVDTVQTNGGVINFQHFGAAYLQIYNTGNIIASGTASFGILTAASLNSTGNTSLNAASALSLTATTGFVALPYTSGVPTGVPTQSNNCAIDTTNGYLNCYWSGAWHKIAFAAGAG